MPSPFPGMDPWLENPTNWLDVHLNLIIKLRRALAPLVAPKYYIEVKQRKVFDFLPPVPALSTRKLSAAKPRMLTDQTKSGSVVFAEPIIVEVPFREKITEDYLEVVEASTHEVITVIEILSWSNKTPGHDRCVYERKRGRIFQTPKHLVEIDLLRAGEPMPFTFLQAKLEISSIIEFSSSAAIAAGALTFILLICVIRFQLFPCLCNQATLSRRFVSVMCSKKLMMKPDMTSALITASRPSHH